MSQMGTKLPVDPTTGEPPFPNVNVAVQQVPDKGKVTRTAANLNLTLDEDALEASGFFTFDAFNLSLSGGMPAAHGHYDAAKDEFINYTYTFCPDKLAENFVFSVKSNGIAEILACLRTSPFICTISLRLINMSYCVCDLLR